jgi:beta-glucosidase
MFNTDANQWNVAEGDYVVRLGSSATDKAAVGTVHVNAGTVRP